MFALKTLGIALAPTLGWLYTAEGLQLLSFAVFTPAVVYWTLDAVSPKDSAKGQALIQNMTFVGACLASVLAGVMLDNMSVRSVLMVSTVVYVLGCIISMLGTSDIKK